MDAPETRSRLDTLKALLAALYTEQAQASARGDQRRMAELHAEIKAANRERAEIVAAG